MTLDEHEAISIKGAVGNIDTSGFAEGEELCLDPAVPGKLISEKDLPVTVHGLDQNGDYHRETFVVGPNETVVTEHSYVSQGPAQDGDQ